MTMSARSAPISGAKSAQSGGSASDGEGRRRIDGLAQPIGRSLGKRDTDEGDDRADLVKMQAKARGVLNDLRGPIGRQRHRQHALLHIDQNQSGGARIKRQHRDGPADGEGAQNNVLGVSVLLVCRLDHARVNIGSRRCALSSARP